MERRTPLKYSFLSLNPILSSSPLKAITSHRPGLESNKMHNRGREGCCWPRATESGAGGTMTTGPMGLRKAVGFRGPIEMTLKNQHVRPEDLFFDRKNR